MSTQKSTESTARVSQNQAAFIAALMKGASVTDAAKQANVDRSTYYLWVRSDPNFVAELNQAKQERLDWVHAQIRDLVPASVATIKDALTGPDVPWPVRVKVAFTVLQIAGAVEPEEIGDTNPKRIASTQVFEAMGIA
jgi:hypothetical protein